MWFHYKYIDKKLALIRITLKTNDMNVWFEAVIETCAGAGNQKC